MRMPARFLSWASLDALPSLFLVAGCPLGLLFAFLMPPLQIPDETAHFYRSFAISGGTCLSPAQQTVPLAVQQLQAVFGYRVAGQRPVRFEDYKHLTRTKWMDGQRVRIPNVNASTYSCVPYLASAMGIELAKLSSQAPIVLLYSARLANLACYLALVYLALRLVPLGQPVLFCLALMPMTLHQAASASADALTIASAFLVFAYVLRLAFDPRIVSLSTRHWLSLGGLLLFATLCKFNPWFVVLLLLIPAAKFGAPKKKVIAIAAFFGLVLLAAIAWQAVDKANLLELKAARMSVDVSIDTNLRFILRQPGEFFAIIARSWWLGGSDYATEFVGCFGWLSVPLAKWLVWTYLGFLILCAVAAESRVRLRLTDRLICAAMVAGSVLSIFMLLWVIEMTRRDLTAEIAGLQGGVVPGVQGRYFIPLAPAFLALAANARVRLNSRLLVAASVAMVLLAGGVALADVHRAYYYGGNRRISRAGAYRDGLWVLDAGGRHQFDTVHPDSNGGLLFGGMPGDLPVVGDWNGDGERKIGIYRAGIWLLDWDGDGQYTSSDRRFVFGGMPGDVPVVGDWTGDGRTKIGVYRGGAWVLDLNGDGKFEPDADVVWHFGGLPNDVPVVGDWNGNGKSKVGIYREGLWLLDSNGNGEFDYPDSAHPDKVIVYRGEAGDIPVVGDWSGDGRPKLGFVRDRSRWLLDLNGDTRFGPGDLDFVFGTKDYISVVGPWAPRY
jgi:uncharacterized membrane protein